MSPEQIKILFYDAIQEKAVYNKLEGITRNQIYNWLNDRGQKPNLGNMLNVLYQLKLISIVLNNEVKAIKEKWEPSTEIPAAVDLDLIWAEPIYRESFSIASPKNIQRKQRIFLENEKGELINITPPELKLANDFGEIGTYTHKFSIPVGIQNQDLNITPEIIDALEKARLKGKK